MNPLETTFSAADSHARADAALEATRHRHDDADRLWQPPALSGADISILSTRNTDMNTNPARDALVAAEMAARPLDPPEIALAAAQKSSTPSAPFAIRNFSVLAYAQGFTLWHYKASLTPLNAVRQPDYFYAAQDILAIGDMIMVSAADGATVLVVASSHRSGVTTAPLA